MARNTAWLVALAVAVALVGCNKAQKVIAKVDDQIITEQDFYSRLEDLDAVSLAAAARTGSFLKAGDVVMQTLITEKLVEAIAKQKGITATDAEIQNYVAFAKKYPGLPASLPENKLRTDEEYRREARYQVLLRKLAAQPLDLKPEDIQKTYDEVKPNLQEKRQFKLRVIGTAAEAKAKEALASLNKGVAFETVALTQSEEPSQKQSGDIGFVPDDPNVVPEALLKEIRKLKPGEWTKSVVKAMGTPPNAPAAPLSPRYYLLKLEEVKPERYPTLDEVRPLIESLALTRKDPNAQLRVRDIVTETIGKAKIVVNVKRYEPVVERIKQAAVQAAQPPAPQPAPAPGN